MDDNREGSIRHPVVAGSFYPGDADVLKSIVQKFLDDATARPDIDPIAIVAPHAGYVYSGWIAGHSYKQIAGKEFDIVVVIAPNHSGSFNFSSVMTGGFYRTPLGDIPIDSETAAAICGGSESIAESLNGHIPAQMGRGEHSLEVQLPFLQVALDDFRLVPIVMGRQDYHYCEALGEVLAQVLFGKKAIIVASSDLSHYHSYNDAKRLDANLIDLLESYDPEQICRELATRKVEACGGGPIVAAMIAARLLGGDKFVTLKYGTSGDVPIGTKDQVVGYLSAAVCKDSADDGRLEKTMKNQDDIDEGLSLNDKRELMDIVRTTVESVVSGEKVPHFQTESKDLLDKRGAFVTLKIDGRLRGCIGYIIPVKSLYLTVQEVAESAAMRDPRFPPVTPEELPLLDYEISALSPIKKIDDTQEIVVGKHGIIIRRGYSQGLLLPQVATEYGWDRQTFLEHTCSKAGLPSQAWKQPNTEISIFSAEVFDEDEIR